MQNSNLSCYARCAVGSAIVLLIAKNGAPEPSHLSRRLQHLRRWSHEEVNEVFA